MIPRTPLRLIDSDVHYKECTVYETEVCNCYDIEKDYEADVADRAYESEKNG